MEEEVWSRTDMAAACALCFSVNQVQCSAKPAKQRMLTHCIALRQWAHVPPLPLTCTGILVPLLLIFWLLEGHGGGVALLHLSKQRPCGAAEYIPSHSLSYVHVLTLTLPPLPSSATSSSSSSCCRPSLGLSGGGQWR
jgi:hypothetical protein